MGFLRMNQPPSSERDIPHLGLFLVAFFLALIQYPLGLDATGFVTFYEGAAVARNLASSGEFRDPFGIPTGPTAHVAPVYPLLFAAVIRLLGYPTALFAIVLLNAAMMGLAAALLPALSRRVYGDATPGFAAGLLLAISGRMMPQWEVAFTALLFLMATFAILKHGPVSAGLWCGASILANPVSLPALAALAVPKLKRYAAVTGLIAITVCVPWMVRNWRVLGAPYFIRDNFGLELYISNHDRSSPALVSNQALFTLHPNQSPAEAAVVAAMGEGPYNRMRLQEALSWIRANPARFLQLSAERVFYYWLPPRREGWQAYSYWLVTALAAAGAWFSRRNRTAVILGISAIAYSLTFVVIQTHVRYRYPSMWISALLAGYAVATAQKRFRHWTDTASSYPPR
jgi:hypothetical protein